KAILNAPRAFFSKEKLIPFSGSFVVEKEKVSSEHGWKQDRYSWANAYQYYLKNISAPTSHFWSVLNSTVRSLITDDRRRVIHGHNFFLNHSHIENLPALQKTI